ncbi:DUF4157 domain-containing protein [Nostoc sp. NMS7]|uniref:eCIS core domain-containing protein n=1 Tax=Nostoc sp. NMS7 TaxID=2815391 RepID=UPI0025CE2FDB|nr:DUF4157 domain-containing protein [Nostoc sp. NMS7]
MTSKIIAQSDRQQKSDKPQESGILQRAAVRSVSETGVQLIEDKEAQPLSSNSAFSKDFSRVPITTTKQPQIMAKLMIGAVGDKYEQEADKVATDVVSRINAPSRQPSGQSKAVQQEAIGITLASKQQLVQRAIYENRNNNEQTVQVNVTNTRIDARVDDRVYGFMKFSIPKDALYIDHIESHPEQGSGLGSLLVLNAALEAAQAGKDIMKITSAAPAAKGFYEHMGFRLDPDEVTKWMKSTELSRDEVINQFRDFINMIGTTSEVLSLASVSSGNRWKEKEREASKASGILQRAAVRSVSEAGVQSTDDKEAQPLSNLAFSKDFSRVPITTTKPQQIMAKLMVRPVEDKYEQEADRVAAQGVQRINAPVSVRSGEDETVQPEEMETKDNEVRLMKSPILQRMSSDGGMAATLDLEASINQARGGGQPMANNIRQPMEQAFGVDFSGVKIHANSQSDRLNQSIQAKAFTTGQDVFFRQGAYEPGSGGGQKLLAHELTHVVQQGDDAGQQRQQQVTGQAHHNATSLISPIQRYTQTSVELNTNSKNEQTQNSKPIQRFTAKTFTIDNTNVTGTLSEKGKYFLPEEPIQSPTIYATSEPSNCIRVSNSTYDFNNETYASYKPKNQYLDDCLHTAEEIVNGKILQYGTSTYSKETITKRVFGQKEGINIEIAKKAKDLSSGSINENANAQKDNAYVIVDTDWETKPSKRSPFHAAGVIGVDGSDHITMEVFAAGGSTTDRNTDAKLSMYTIGSGKNSFHGYWSSHYFQSYETITIVIKAK